jgi:hypothetical protein
MLIEDKWDVLRHDMIRDRHVSHCLIFTCHYVNFNYSTFYFKMDSTYS